jgi:hypothetical protein
VIQHGKEPPLIAALTGTTNTLRVVPLSTDGEDAYRHFLEEIPAAGVYPSLEFRGFLERVVGGRPTYLVAERAGRILGVLPFFTRHDRTLGTVVNSLPWFGSHGGCVLAPHTGDAVRRALLRALAAALDRDDLLSATVVLTAEEDPRREAYARELPPRAWDVRVGQVSALPDARDEGGDAPDSRILGAMAQKTRNLVRKALGQGFEELITDEAWAWAFLHQTHRENMLAVGGTPKPREHFDALRETFPPACRRLSIALLGRVPVAALLLLACHRTVEYVTPVIVREHRPRQPLSFLIFRAMLAAAQDGYQRWNWGGTWPSQRSLHHFKAGWGAEDRPYSYLVHASEQGLARLRRHRSRAVEAFPFYYLYPFELLERRASGSP